MRLKKIISQNEYHDKYKDVCKCQLDLNSNCQIQYDYEQTTEQKCNRLVEGLMNLYPDAMMYQGIAEMGYEDKPTILFNWNKLPNYFKWEKLLNECGIELDWEDEYTTCSNCYKLVRTNADSYGWEPSYIWANDCEIICHECIKDNDSWLEDAIEWYNKENKAFPSWIKPLIEKIGFTQLNEDSFESGFHRGQNDDPMKELKKIEDKYDQIVFILNDSSQFYITWDIMVRNQKEDE